VARFAVVEYAVVLHFIYEWTLRRRVGRSAGFRHALPRIFIADEAGIALDRNTWATDRASAIMQMAIRLIVGAADSCLWIFVTYIEWRTSFRAHAGLDTKPRKG